MIDEATWLLFLLLRWAWLSLAALGVLWLSRQVATLEGRPAGWPWWLPLLLGALLTVASVAGRRG